MPRIESIPISTRVCDLCNDAVTDEEHVVTKSFILTDWGVICVECWDKRLVHPEEFLVAQHGGALVSRDHSAAYPPRDLHQRPSPDRCHRGVPRRVQSRPEAVRMDEGRGHDLGEGRSL